MEETMQREDGLTKASEVAKLIREDLTGLTAWEIRNMLSQVLTAVSKTAPRQGLKAELSSGELLEGTA
jgi:hypothetical protein